MNMVHDTMTGNYIQWM